MLNKETIQELKKSEVTQSLEATISTIGPVEPVVAVPDDFSLRSLEEFMSGASSFRFNFNTQSFSDFVAYNIKFDVEDALCFVDVKDPRRMSATTIFDIGSVESPGHKRHRAKIELKETAAYSALLNIDGRKMDQRGASDFLEDWGDFISVETNQGDHISASLAAAKLRDLTIESAREASSKIDDFGSELSAMEKIEAKNKNSLPAFLIFTCVPYLDFQPVQFGIRLSILTGDAVPKISLRIVQLEQTLESISDEFKTNLVTEFESMDIETFIGTF